MALSKLYYYVRAIPKSLVFNFRYLPFRQAIRFPIVVSHQVKLVQLGGKVTIPDDAKTGKIRLGFGRVQVAEPSRSPFIWAAGKGAHIQLGHRVKLGTGCKLHVDGELIIHDCTNFTGESTLICKKKIEVGSNCLISWQTLIMDTDFHPIYHDHTNERLNPDAPITIGDKVWIGARSSLSKGSQVPRNSVVAAAAHVTKAFEVNNVIIGGNPAKIIGSMENKHFTD